MKKDFFLPVIVGIIVLVVGSYVFYQLTLKAPDLRFTLSDPIPVSFLNPTGGQEIIQQLEVKNIGNAKSEKVHVKINGEIALYKLDKHSEFQESPVLNQNGTFELSYPELPPETGFKLTLKSLNNDVNLSNLRVYSNSGSAQAALDPSATAPWYLSPIFWTTLVISLLIQLLFIRSSVINTLEYNIREGKREKLIEANKPWYLRTTDWQRIINRVWLFRLATDNQRKGGIQYTDSYFLLSSERPEHIMSDCWENLIHVASNRLKEFFNGKLSYAPAPSALNLLKLTKPKYFPDPDWQQLRDGANNRYCDLMKRDIRDENLTAFLTDNKPEEIDIKFWTILTHHLQRRLTAHFEHQILVRGKSSLAYLQGENIDVLDAVDRDTILKRAYKASFPDYLDVADLAEAEKFLAAERPEGVEDWDYSLARSRAQRFVDADRRLKESEKRTEEAEKRSAEARVESQRSQAEFSAHVEKTKQMRQKLETTQTVIENQLDIIDKVLNRPNEVERIEEYSHSFAPGNFENLKRLASLLTSA